MSSPQLLILRREHPDFWTTAEVAAIVKFNKRTLLRWRQGGVLVPSAYRDMGRTRVWLYSWADLERARELAQERRQ